ncbi:hypothetical protein JKP88DRAFT_289180 [Tribonema minus]|uniref:Uncharacterized protein n=1 Tax=Tribonema minus TaxID=303371 RepID=A0A835Z315_9STRA|nr:hypothetical protein JKP88DRAFT_289180 [Tribonema minus]
MGQLQVASQQLQGRPVALQRLQGRPVRVMLGEAPDALPLAGWVSTDINVLDLTQPDDFKYVLGGSALRAPPADHSRNSAEDHSRNGAEEPFLADAFLAEHVWEHLSAEEAHAGAQLVHRHLRAGGRLRIAVPDPNFNFRDDRGGERAAGASAPSTTPSPAALSAAPWLSALQLAADVHDGHRIQYTLPALAALCVSAGFERVAPREWTDSSGNFHMAYDDDFAGSGGDGGSSSSSSGGTGGSSSVAAAATAAGRSSRGDGSRGGGGGGGSSGSSGAGGSSSVAAAAATDRSSSSGDGPAETSAAAGDALMEVDAMMWGRVRRSAAGDDTRGGVSIVVDCVKGGGAGEQGGGEASSNGVGVIAALAAAASQPKWRFALDPAMDGWGEVSEGGYGPTLTDDPSEPASTESVANARVSAAPGAEDDATTTGAGADVMAAAAAAATAAAAAVVAPVAEVVNDGSEETLCGRVLAHRPADMGALLCAGAGHGARGNLPHASEYMANVMSAWQRAAAVAAAAATAASAAAAAAAGDTICASSSACLLSAGAEQGGTSGERGEAGEELSLSAGGARGVVGMAAAAVTEVQLDAAVSASLNLSRFVAALPAGAKDPRLELMQLLRGLEAVGQAEALSARMLG